MSKIKLPENLEISIWNSERTLLFEYTQDIIEWAQGQLENWPVDGSNKPSVFRDVWQNHRECLLSIIRSVESIEQLSERTELSNQAVEIIQHQQAFQSQFVKVSNGTLLTSEHPYHSRIIAIFNVDPDAAATLLAASRSDGHKQIRVRPNQQLSLDSLARIGAAVAHGNREQSVAAESHVRELATLKNKFEEEIAELRGKLNAESERSEENQRSCQSQKEMGKRCQGHFPGNFPSRPSLCCEMRVVRHACKDVRPWGKGVRDIFRD